jgi:hypothetical protein
LRSRLMSEFRHGLGTRRVKIEGINTNITPRIV